MLIAVLLAAEPVDPLGGDWGNILATYGLAAPFLLFLILVIRELRKDVAIKDQKIEDLTTAMTEKVIPAITHSNTVLNQAMDIIKEARETTSAVVKAGELVKDGTSAVNELIRELRRRDSSR